MSQNIGESSKFEDDPEDPVIRELDVFVSQSLSNQLFVFQYPHRPVHRPLGTPAAARIRPKHRNVELEYNVNVEGPNFNKDAIPMKRQVLASQHMPAATNYCVAAIRDSQLHLSPLNSIVQLHPDFRHIDEAVEEVKMIDDDDDEDEEGQKKEKPKETKKMELQQVSYKKKETDDQASRRKKGYAFLRDELRRDPFVDLTVFDADSDQAFDRFEGLFCPTPAPMRRFKQDGAAFLSSLNYRGPLEDSAHAAVKPNDPTVSVEPAAPTTLSDKVMLLVKAAGLLSFRSLMDCEVGSAGPDELLQALMRHAVLVRGNWALRSGRRENLSEAQVMARDVILILMEKYGAVSRLQLEEGFGNTFTRPQLIELLSEFSLLNKTHRRWEMKLPDCYQFLESYPAVAAEQQRQWRVREREAGPLLQMIGPMSCPVIGPIKKTSSDLAEEPEIQVLGTHASLPAKKTQLATFQADVKPASSLESQEEQGPNLFPTKQEIGMETEDSVKDSNEAEPEDSKANILNQAARMKPSILQPRIGGRNILVPGQKASFQPKIKPKIQPSVKKG